MIDDFEKYVIQIFKERNNQKRWAKYKQGSDEMNIFNQTPQFDWTQILSFTSEVKSTHNVKLGLIKIGYYYVFEKYILDELMLISDSEIPVFVACYQMISLLLYTNNAKMEISEEDFQCFMQILQNNVIEDNKFELNFLFQIILNAAFISIRNGILNINEIIIKTILSHFDKNQFLNNKLYPLFVQFIAIIKEQKNYEYTNTIIDILYKFFKENRKIIDVENYDDILELINDQLQKLNKNAFFIFSEITKRKTSQTQKFDFVFGCLPQLFVNTSKLHILSKSNPEKTNDMDVCYELNNNLEVKINNLNHHFDIINGCIQHFPNELYSPKFNFFSKLNDETKTLVKTFDLFLSNIASTQYYTFFLDQLKQVILKECSSEINNSLCFPPLNVYGSYLYLFYHIKENYYSNYLSIIFQNNLSNIFDPSETVFGPNSLDLIVNDFRSTFIDMIANKKKLLIQLLVSRKNCICIATEILSRYLIKIETQTIQKNILNDEILNAIVEISLTIPHINSHVLLKSAIIYNLCLLSQLKYSFYQCLTNKDFVNCIFFYILENGITSFFLSSLNTGILQLTNEKISHLKYFTGFLFNILQFDASNSMNAEFFVKLKKDIFSFVCNTIRYIPKLIKIYNYLLFPILNNVNSIETMNQAFYFLQTYSKINSFKLDQHLFQIMVQKINYINFINLINLIAGDFLLSSNNMFLIRNPYFLPLFFLQSNFNSEQSTNLFLKTSDFLYFFKKLAHFSEYNRQALHDGKVDLILLSSINQQFYAFRGYKFNLKIKDKLEENAAFELLSLILSSKSSNEFAHLMTDTIIKNNITLYSKINLAKELSAILHANYNCPHPAFEIGNIHSFARIEGLNSLTFKGTFTVTFKIKVDMPLLNCFGSQVLILTILDRSNHRVSICIQKAGLFAVYEESKYVTFVSLCQIIPSNQWITFSIVFLFQNETYNIVCFKNFERQHNSDFCPINFDLGPLNLIVGGYVPSQSKTIQHNKIGMVAHLNIFNRVLSSNELINNLLKTDDAPTDFLFSTDFLNEPKSFNNKKVFSISLKEKSLKLTIHQLKNSFIKYSINDFMKQYYKKLIQNFHKFNIQDLKYILDILKFSLVHCIDEEIPKVFAINLMKKMDEFNNSSVKHTGFEIFHSIFLLIENIPDKNTKYSWLRYIIFNLNLWGKSNNFDLILYFLSSSIVELRDFLLHFNYFDSFLFFFIHMYNISDTIVNFSKVVQYFITLISRLTFINFKKENCNVLFSQLASENISIPTKVEMLKIIQYSSKNIINLDYKDYLNILNLLKENNSIIVFNAILAIQNLYSTNFYLNIPKIISYIMFTKELFDLLQNSVNDYPDLFSLNCALALENNIDISSIKIPHNENSSNYSKSQSWFYFPILAAINSTNSLDIYEFIVKNSINDSRTINNIIYFTLLLSNFAENLKSDSSLPIKILINSYIDAANQINLNNDIVFLIFFSAIAFICYHLNETSMSINENKLLYSTKAPTKIKLSSINDLYTFKKTILNEQRLSFFYYVPSNTDEIKESALLTKALVLAETLENYLINDTISKKSNFSILGLSSNSPLFSINDIREILNDINSNIRMISIDRFTKMNLLFPWMQKRLTYQLNIEKHEIQTIIDAMIERKESNKNSGLSNTNFKQNNDNLSHTNSYKSNEMLPILAFNYCRYLLRIEKNHNKIFNSTENALLEFNELKPEINYHDNVIYTESLIDDNHAQSLSIQFYSNGFKIMQDHVKYIDLKYVLMVQFDSVLLITNTGKSYLIKFSDSASNVSNKIEDLHSLNGFIQNIKKQVNTTNCFIADNYTSMIIWFKTIFSNWVNSNITTFDFICVLNLISGRTFFDKSNYPIFPSLLFLDDNNPLNEKESNIADESIFEIPEVYFLYEKYPQAYENRHKLEILSYNNSRISLFFAKAFPNLFQTPPSVRANQIIQNTSFQKVAIFSEEKIPSKESIFLSKLRHPELSNMFCYITKNGKILFVQCLFDDYGQLRIINKSSPYLETIKSLKNEKFSGTELGIIAYDGKNLKFYSPNQPIREEQNTYLEQFVFSNREEVFLSNPSAISLPSHILFPIRSQLSTLTTNTKYNIFVVGCCDGTLRINTLDGSKVSKILFYPEKTSDTNGNELAYNYPIKTLITDVLGFIIVYYNDQALLISTMNGTVLHRISHFSKIEYWFTFCIDSKDYIGFIESFNDKNLFLKYFDAEDPSSIIEVMELPFHTHSVEIIYNKSRNCFIVADIQNMIYVIPNPK